MLIVEDEGSFLNVPVLRFQRLKIATEVLRRVEGLFGRHPPLGERRVQFPHYAGPPCADIQVPHLYRAFTVLDDKSSDAQVVYQVGHELAHFFLGPCHTCFAAETIACAVAHESLRQLGHHAYLADAVVRANRESSNVPQQARNLADGDFIKWVRSEKAANRLPMDDRGRALHSIAAELLRASAPPWPDFTALAHSTDPVPKPCPPEGEPHGSIAWRFLGPKEIVLGSLPEPVRVALASFGCD